MRSNLFSLGMCSAVAAVAVAGSANAAIVWSGVQSPAAANPDNIVLTPNGSFYSSASAAYGNDNPLFVAYGSFGGGNGTGYTAAAVLQGAGDTGASGDFRFQLYGTLGGSGASNRRVVNNSFGTSISGLSGTIAYNSTATSGSGFAVGTNFGAYNNFFLNTNAASGALQGQFYNTTGYIGFRFSTDGGTSWFFGWAKWTGGTDGTGALSEWAYNDTAGGSITAGQVPAPGALALLGAAGLVGARRRR
jgi:MYXO-CTERM domain-containing protein